MKVPYVCCTKNFEDHYLGVGSGLAHYQGVNFQKGYGLGGFFRRMFRAALPFLVRGGQTLGKEVIRTGTQVVSDVLEGQNLKESAKKRSQDAGKSIARKTIDTLQGMVGKGKYKRRRKKQKRVIPSKKRKENGRDIFDE